MNPILVAYVRSPAPMYRDRGAPIFLDPDQLSLYDEEHREAEDRWVTMGIDGGGTLRVVVHTFEQLDQD